MSSENLRDIYALLVVARERSFTRAAAQLGVSQSALSHAIRALEARLGLRLLTRTTRSVAPTEAGERLIASVTPRFDTITRELAALGELRDKPAGTVRITTSDFAAQTVLWPKLSGLQRQHPDIRIELNIDTGLTDIVSERFDAGVRFGDQIAKDMTSIPISAATPVCIVATPQYLAQHGTPQTPADLTRHLCINLRFALRGGLYAWELQQDGRSLQVRVDGPWVFNQISMAVEAALAGCGLAYVPVALVRAPLESGHLQTVLPDFCPTFPALHIYYANRHQASPALALVIETLRYHA
ncbi:LysR family transcriptional regulator [Amantichitinum ursilacus]|uniref:HTH-type transcriptional regulator DmlR n=1 Tax=Amantichitinum ursilacus TaxID=857265 RepID=A0A0N0XN69_9NEIS|nr:LysR family transcriptional regulator [Amantichitinum ursilacus]KPC55405.1 HTH-type transcriptional regulator DmlR [Amantichitinum ursilacus]